jgi:opacity protein-like surface antigen
VSAAISMTFPPAAKVNREDFLLLIMTLPVTCSAAKSAVIISLRRIGSLGSKVPRPVGNIGHTTTFATTVAVPGDDTATFKATTDFLASITGRIGYAFDRWMLYGKGGVALAGDRYHAADAAGNYAFDGTEDRLGWTAGAGIEWAFDPDWSVKLEYGYYGFGTKSVLLLDSITGTLTAPVNIRQNIQVVKLGINFHARSGPDW